MRAQAPEVTRHSLGGACGTLADGTIRKYYGFGGHHVAMRAYDPGTEEWTLSYFLTDHLGSVVATTDDIGSIVEEQRYLPFGAAREDMGELTATDFGYTSQRNMSEIGLMDYKARFYSVTAMRFIQPDILIPGLAKPQALNRYSYVLNLPTSLNDPTGYVACEEVNSSGQCVELTTKDYEDFYRSNLKEKFDWEAGDDFALDELKLIYQTGLDILSYVNGLTGGQGAAWMSANLAGTLFAHPGTDAPWYVPRDSGSAFPGWASGTGVNTVYLPSDFMTGGYGALPQYVAHELGHVWDMHTGTTNIGGTVGGVADALNSVIGGSPGIVSRFSQNTFWHFGLKIPEEMQFGLNVRDGYGNGSSADYLAEAFGWRVYDAPQLPNDLVRNVIDVLVINQAEALQ